MTSRPSDVRPRKTRAEWQEFGRQLRRRCARSAQGEWTPPRDRPDPIALLERSNSTRVPELVPVRIGRMLESPFSYYRGAPLVMASDLARSPSTGIDIQICGDAHLLNFGMYATPERNLIFDVNDFDETYRGPWEWDVKRFVASIAVAARTSGFTDPQAIDLVHRASAEYRSTMAVLAECSPFEVWHSRVDVNTIASAAPNKPARAQVQREVTKARRRTSLQALSKLTTVVDGRRVIVEDPPLVTRLTADEVAQAHRLADSYRRRLEPDRRLLLDRYEFVDAARKVVGVGSVGTRCFIVLLAASVDLDPLFLQIKEAQPSVIEQFSRPGRFRNQGERVVAGQRVMQAASDVFLGWARADGFDVYVRQVRDMKWSAPLDSLDVRALADYARLCGGTLARAHARAGEPALLAGYMGSGTAFDDALVRFALAYADQIDRDYAEFLKAVKSGRLPATLES